MTREFDPMHANEPPIKPLEPELPVIPTSRWRTLNNPVCLHKQYEFLNNDQRSAFVRALFAYEEKTQHIATLTVSDCCVDVCVVTANIEQVTEIDMEYAAYADVVYKDTMYGTTR